MDSFLEEDKERFGQLIKGDSDYGSFEEADVDIRGKANEIKNKVDLLNSDADRVVKEIKPMDSELKSLRIKIQQSEGEPETQRKLINQHNSLVEKINEKKNYLKDKSKEYDSLNKDYDYLRDQYDIALKNNQISLSVDEALSKRYGVMDKIKKGFDEAFTGMKDIVKAISVDERGDALVGVSYTPYSAVPAKRYYKPSEKEVKENRDMIWSEIEKSQMDLKKRSEEVPEPMTIDEAIEYNNPIGLLEDSLSSNAFSLAGSVLLYSNPYTATAVPFIFGLSSAGDRLGELTLHNKEHKDYTELLKTLKAEEGVSQEQVDLIDKELLNLEKVKTYSRGEIVDAALLSGTIEAGVTGAAGAVSRLGLTEKGLSKTSLPTPYIPAVSRLLDIGVAEVGEESIIAGADAAFVDELLLGRDVDFSFLSGDIYTKDFFFNIIVNAGAASSATVGALKGYEFAKNVNYNVKLTKGLGGNIFYK